MNDLEKKKQDLLKKYQSPSTSLNDYKKFALMRCEGGIEFFGNSELIVVTDTEEEVLQELKWRKDFSETGDMDVAMKGNSKLHDFYDSSESNRSFKEIAKTPLEAKGQFFILPFWEF